MLLYSVYICKILRAFFLDLTLEEEVVEGFEAPQSF
jgi:hypothetical protein